MGGGRPLSPVALFLGSVAYLYSSIHHARVSPDIFVDTNQGALRGIKTISRAGRPYYAFRGVPYAQPPLGTLRFEPPEPPTNWAGVKDATRYGSRCWQLNFITQRLQGKEDCLFLNVFTHKVVPKEDLNDTLLYPVLVYIHGGFFMSGGSNIFRPKYFMDENVVFVTLNYRLGPLGFLSTGDDVVRGNMGLKDQVMALRWIQENIAYFGGDPESVTLIGESAGAVCVHLHMMSPMSKGLFHRAISQSGTGASLWARLLQDPKNQAEKLAKRLNCPSDSSLEMSRCLKSRSAGRVARSHSSFIRDLFQGKFSVFSPTIEAVNDSSTFLSQDPKELLSNGVLASSVPWINGVNSDEGLIYLIGVIRNETRLAPFNVNWTTYAPVLFGYEDNPDRDLVSVKIREYYLNNGSIGMDKLQESANMFSDRAFFEDSHDSVVLQSKLAPVYSYYLSYKPEFGIANFLLSSRDSLPQGLDLLVGNAVRWISSNILGKQTHHYGLCHTDELPLFYNLPALAEIVPGSIDYSFSKEIVKLWVTFAKKGKPGSFRGVPWEPVQVQQNQTGPYHSIKRMKLDRVSEMVEEPFMERLLFWKSLGLDKTHLGNISNQVQ